MRSLKFLVILLSLGVFGLSNLNAQIDQPAKWKYSLEKATDNNIKVIIDAKVDDAWHLYGIDFPEGGPIPLLLTLDNEDKYKVVSKFTSTLKAKEEYDDIFMINVKYFSHKAQFVQIIKPTTDKEFTATLVVDGQACHDEGKCVMLSEEFEIKIDPEKFITVEKAKETTKVETPKETTTVKEEYAENNSTNSEEKIKAKEATVEQHIEINETLAQGTEKKAVVAENTEPEKEEGNILGTFLLAIVLGLAGILTPCVFPMIPMTVSFFMKDTAKKSSNVFQAILFGLSIVFLYTLVGIIVSLTSAGADLTTVLSTHWIPNAIFFLLFIVFAGSFFGLYEIVLPNGLANKADSQVDKGGMMSAFFMAVTLVLVSFACTGPIVGALLVKAATGSVLEPTIGMLGFGIGFGLPFTILALSPNLLNKLPQSGVWMNSVKVVMGFIILAFSLKFLSNIDQGYHLNLMSRDFYLVMWIIIFVFLGLYLLGKFKLAHDSDVQHLSVFRLVLSMGSFAFALYLLPGLFGADLTPVSGLIPPKTTQQFIISTGDSNNHTSENKAELCDDAKYTDFLHMAEGVQGYFDYEQGIECAKEQNKPVMLYFTGHSCANCKKMMSAIWTDATIQKYFNNEFIFIELYVDERYKLPEDEWVTSVIDNKIKKTIGSKNADFQITKFNINSQPFYAMLTPEGEILHQAIKYETNPTAFIEWMEIGLKEFK